LSTNIKFDHHKKFIIGGPSRNGKTTLVHILYRKHGSIIGLPVEGLFYNFYCRNYPLRYLQKNIILREYLEQERYIDENRTKTARPLDFFYSDLHAISKQISAKSNHHLQIISSALEFFARDNKAKTWAVCDLHPEFYFSEFKKWIPNLHLVIMLRDPREAICANLYWRCYPNKNSKAGDLLEYRTMMWILSAEMFLYWKKLYPDEVTLLFFNDLLNKNETECKKLSHLFDIPEDSLTKYFSDKKLYFKYTDGKFQTPGGELSKLMTNEELSFVENLTLSYVKKFGWNILSSFNDENNSKSATKQHEAFSKKLIKAIDKLPMEVVDYINSSMAFSKEGYISKKQNLWKSELLRNIRNAISFFYK